MIVDALAVITGIFKTPMAGQRTHKVHIRNKPSIPNNSKHWYIFEDDEQIKRLLELSDEFANTQIDNENCHLKNFQDSNGGEQGID